MTADWRAERAAKRDALHKAWLLEAHVLDLQARSGGSCALWLNLLAIGAHQRHNTIVRLPYPTTSDRETVS